MWLQAWTFAWFYVMQPSVFLPRQPTWPPSQSVPLPSFDPSLPSSAPSLQAAAWQFYLHFQLFCQGFLNLLSIFPFHLGHLSTDLVLHFYTNTNRVSTEAAAGGTGYWRWFKTLIWRKRHWSLKFAGSRASTKPHVLVWQMCTDYG